MLNTATILAGAAIMGSGGPAPVPINPYESPGYYASDSPEAESEVESSSLEPGVVVNAWRDELLLVVSARGPLVFPGVCIKSGKPLKRNFTTPQTITSLPLNHPLTNKKWPVSREWEEEIPLSQLLGLISCAGGFLLLVVSMGVAAARVTPVIAAPILAIALFSVFAGLFMLALSYRIFLTAVDIRSSYVWLAGAHPDFLKELPAWTVTTGSRATRTEVA